VLPPLDTTQFRVIPSGNGNEASLPISPMHRPFKRETHDTMRRGNVDSTVKDGHRDFGETLFPQAGYSEPP